MADSKSKKNYVVGQSYILNDGKRYKYLGDGNWQGNPIKKPSMQKIKSAPAYDSNKRKTSIRKYGKSTR